MRTLLISIMFVIVSGVTMYAQSDSLDINVKAIRYEPVTEDYFADYGHAKLIVNYYCSDGWSANNRYSFEVVLIDSMLMLGFDSPETESMRYISYQKKILISSAMVDTMKNMLGRAGLTQVKNGIPRATAAANTKEVLIIRYGNLNIAGGLFYYNMLQEDASQDKINNMIERERKLTSSIGGDYDSIMKAMKNFFPELSNLMSQALKFRKKN